MQAAHIGLVWENNIVSNTISRFRPICKERQQNASAKKIVQGNALSEQWKGEEAFTMWGQKQNVTRKPAIEVRMERHEEKHC